MFLNLEVHPSDHIAIIDDAGNKMTYGALRTFAEQFYKKVGKRALTFHLCSNSIGSAAGYYAAMTNQVVPLLLGAAMDREMLNGLIDTYHPEYLWIPLELKHEFSYEVLWEAEEYCFIKTELVPYPMYKDLSLLLTTSGSTGSPKLVRHSYQNLEANARNISEFFQLNSKERPMIDTPMNYTYGLSVVNSHLYSGATLLLTNWSLMKKEFWDFFKQEEATSFTGVPYSYEVLRKLRFFRMKLPSLQTLSQGGGKLTDDLYREFAEFAESTGRKMYFTYGQTEGSARMAYLPPELAAKKIGSIGIAIPNGRLSLIDSEGKEIEEIEASGELVFQGSNVTLGYAVCGEDLIKGDERFGMLRTGDMARRDKDGYYYIIGRMKRFLKLFGFRVGLDECERLLKEEFKVECACTGTDDKMLIYLTDSKDAAELAVELRRFLIEKTGIYHAAFEVQIIPELPKNEAGKILYSKL